MTYSSAQLKWEEESLLLSISVVVPMKMEWVSEKKIVYNKFDSYGHTYRSLDRTVGVEARLQAEWFRVRIRLGKIVFSAQSPDCRWKTDNILCIWYRGSGLWVKRPESDVDRSPPASSVVNSEWSYASISRCFYTAWIGTT